MCETQTVRDGTKGVDMKQTKKSEKASKGGADEGRDAYKSAKDIKGNRGKKKNITRFGDLWKKGATPEGWITFLSEQTFLHNHSQNKVNTK